MLSEFKQDVSPSALDVLYRYFSNYTLLPFFKVFILNFERAKISSYLLNVFLYFKNLIPLFRVFILDFERAKISSYLLNVFLYFKNLIPLSRVFILDFERAKISSYLLNVFFYFKNFSHFLGYLF